MSRSQPPTTQIPSASTARWRSSPAPPPGSASPPRRRWRGPGPTSPSAPGGRSRWPTRRARSRRWDGGRSPSPPTSPTRTPASTSRRPRRRSSGRVDVLLNNAGVATAVPAIRETPEEFNRVVEVNLAGCFQMATAAARQMDDGGSIINVSSIIALTTALPSPGRLLGEQGGTARPDPRPRPAVDRPQGDPRQRDLPRLLPHRQDHRPVPARIPPGQGDGAGADRPGGRPGRVRRDRGLPRRRRAPGTSPARRSSSTAASLDQTTEKQMV